MGLCFSGDGHLQDSEGRAISKKVHQDLIEQQSAEASTSKLLLLGAGASGKSTLFKQMMIIYGTGFSLEEKRAHVAIIYNNVINSARSLCVHSRFYPDVPVQNLEALDFGLQLQEEDHVDETVGAMIEALWADPGIQHTYKFKSEFGLFDSARYYFERLHVIKQDHYLPTPQDVLRSRVPTTGIVEKRFNVHGNEFIMFDVGGQRSERKKWIHCFEDVTAVIFVASLSAFNQSLYEDEQRNDMLESLELFGEISNSTWFKSTSVILFLNKCDLFLDKIEVEGVQLRDTFPDYDGPNTYEDCADYIKALFLARNETKDMYTHITCATDKDNIYAVFMSVKDIVIKKGLCRAGLM